MHFLSQLSNNNSTVVMKTTSGISKNINIIVFLDVTSRSLVEIYSSFGITCCLPLQCRGWRQQVFPEYQQICVRMHGVISRSYATYVVGSKSFRPDIQKPLQMENAVRDI